jgi:hypothetical protein
MNLFSFLGDALKKLQAVAAAVAALLPVIDAAVKQAEVAIGAGNGSTKLQFVLDTIEAVIGKGETVVNGVTLMWTDLSPAITSIINAIVAAYNSVKAFSGGAAPAPAPATT